MTLSKVNPPSKNPTWRRAATAALGVLLLAGCWPSPPPQDTDGIPLAATPTEIPGRSKTFAALDLPLNPLANKDQLLRSFQAGRKDPFGNVILSQKVPLTKVAEAEAGAVVSGVSGQGGASPAGKDTSCDSSPIQVTGLIYGSGASEAIVYNKTTGETGSLRPGDRGGRSTTLLPLGCQVQSIDVNAGYLVIAPVKKGSAVKLTL